jgi:hypothetical protein
MPSASRPAVSLAQSKRLAVLSTAFCALAVIAAVVAFAGGSRLGILWVLLAGVTSNMAWFYARRVRQNRPRPGAEPG